MENRSAEEFIAGARRLAMFILGLRAAEAEQQRRSVESNNPVFVFDVSPLATVIPLFPADKPGPLPASKASIDAIPTVTVTEDRVMDCAICLEEMVVGGEVREMPCKHGFHSLCIEKWLEIHGSCPVCRFLMPVEDGGAADGSVNGRRQRRRLISLDLIIFGPAPSSSSDSGSDSSPDIER